MIGKDKLELWIENNRVKYLFLLAGLGYFLGYLFFYLVGHSNWIEMGFRVGSLIAATFIVIDLTIHNK